MLQGEADPAEHLDAVLGDVDGAVERDRGGHRGGEPAAAGSVVGAGAASHAAAVTDSEVSSISAHRCLIAWKEPIFWPNCSRTPAYSTAVSRHQRATPDASAAASVTTRSRTRSGVEARHRRSPPTGEPGPRSMYDASGRAVQTPGGSSTPASGDQAHRQSPSTTQRVGRAGCVGDHRRRGRARARPRISPGATGRRGRPGPRTRPRCRAAGRAPGPRAASSARRGRAPTPRHRRTPRVPRWRRSPISARPVTARRTAGGSSSARRTASIAPRSRPTSRTRRASSTWSSLMPIGTGSSGTSKLERVPIMPCGPDVLRRGRLHRSMTSPTGLGCARDPDARRPAGARPRRQGVHARGRGRPPARHRAEPPRRTGRRWRSAPTAASRRSSSARPRGRPAARCSPSTTTAARRRTRPAGSTTTRAWSTRSPG